MKSIYKQYFLFQFLLWFSLIRFVYEITLVNWFTTEAAEEVGNGLSIHISICGTWIVWCLFWKIIVPFTDFFAEEWQPEDLPNLQIVNGQ